MSTRKLPDHNGCKQFLDLVASRLVNDGLSVQRGIRVDPYTFDTLASRTMTTTTFMDIKILWTDIIAVSSVEVRSPDDARGYSSFVAKYALENRHTLGARRNGLSTIAVMVSESFGDDTKQWVSETSPSFSEMWARTEFPVLVELSSRQITCYRKTPFRKYGLYQNLQKLSDKWFGFQV